MPSLSPYETIVAREALDARGNVLRGIARDVKGMQRTGETLRILQRCEKDIRTLEQIRGKL